MTDGLRPIGQVAAEIVADVRFRALVRALHGKGPRVLAEFLAELAAERSIMTPIQAKLESYAMLPPEVLQALGLDEDSPRPQLRVVPRDGPEAA